MLKRFLSLVLFLTLSLFLRPAVGLAGQLHGRVNEVETLTLTAPAGSVITSVDFASYGNATDNGDGTYTLGSCHAANSRSVVESYALNQNSFSIYVVNDTFKDAANPSGDPCFGTGKTLSVVVTYAEPLPVTLTSFTAAASPSQPAVKLAWTTATELNSSHFEVQRSTTGTTFEAIGTVAAAGSSHAQHAYAFRDATLPTGPTTLYYRLRHLDADGSGSYSPVRSVAVAAATAGTLALYPNPAHAAATLTGAGAHATVQVLTLLGTVVATTAADATGAATLPLPSGLTAGIYVVRTGSHTLRLIVD